MRGGEASVLTAGLRVFLKKIKDNKQCHLGEDGVR